MCAELGLLPQQVVHVGDHQQNDIAAAQQAGMPAVWVNRTASVWSLDNHAPDHEVGNLEELADVLDKKDSVK